MPEPRNEPVRDYAPGSAQVTSLQKRLGDLAGNPIDLTMTIDGVQRMAGGARFDVVAAAQARATSSARPATPPATTPRPRSTAAQTAAPGWRALSFDDRAAIFLRAAELLAGPWRDTLNAATMLGQSQDRATRPRSTRPAS